MVQGTAYTIKTCNMHNYARQCTLHVACFISGNFGFLDYLLSATIGVFQNSACWHIDSTMGTVQPPLGTRPPPAPAQTGEEDPRQPQLPAPVWPRTV